MPSAINNFPIRPVNRVTYSNATKKPFTSKRVLLWINLSASAHPFYSRCDLHCGWAHCFSLIFDCLMLFGRESEHWQQPSGNGPLFKDMSFQPHSCLLRLDKSLSGPPSSRETQRESQSGFRETKHISTKCTILLFLSPLRIWLNHIFFGAMFFVLGIRG